MKLRSSTLSIIPLFLFCGIALASDPVQITVTGQIVASPCSISTENGSQTVNLGDDLQSADLQNAGSPTPWKDFTVILDKCPAGTTTVDATFHGTPDDVSPNYYKNLGDAKSLVIQLDSKGGTYVLRNGYVWSQSVVNGTVTYNFSVRAYSDKGGVTPGTISSVITIDFAYK
ncbi:fimbrial protein [Enterobacter roggenkampii]|uniref:fimbrial protein n=1 Tax=Enterobacter roggenkampii TaxID=1812935 RepID=UPI002A803474|nr:fimbrial protein [Enterobacter roggenkampii]